MDLAEILRAIDGALAGETAAPVGSPWLAWLTIVVMRHRARQAWHRALVNTLASDDGDEEGAVPGHPGWQFRFHGSGCLLSGPDGEQIDVDYHDVAAALIDPYFFAARIESVRGRDLPERRLWRWLPHGGALVAALADLHAAGVLVHPRGAHLFRLCDALEARVAALVDVDFTDPVIAARWLAALGDSDEPAVIAAHHRWFVTHASARPDAYKLLPAAAAVLTADELVGVCEALLAGPIDASAGQAVETLRRLADARGEPLVQRLLARITAADPPYPAYQSLAFLLERGEPTPALQARFAALAGVEQASGFRGNPFLGEYAILALRALPALAMGLVRRALRSTTPVAVSDIAEMLAAIDQPWCHRELAAALAERPDETWLAEALRRSSAPTLAAPYTPPAHDPARVGFSHAEVVHHSIGALFDDLDEHERRVALELRAAYPPDWPG